MNDHWTIYESPLGPLTLVGEPGTLRAVSFPGRSAPLDVARRDPAAFADVEAQFEEYFAGERTQFELHLELTGTEFQRRVWQELRAIPYGTTVSYLTLANALNRPDRVRAVGGAVGRTPIPIIVPCHRVIGSDGSLTGYGGGLQRKRTLLDLEAGTAAGLGLPLSGHRQLTLT